MAPGDSTVVELTFDTKVYKTAVTKNATIYSNDLSNSQAKIYVSAKVDVKPDSTLSISWEPSRVDFDQKTKSAVVTVKNTGKARLDLASAGDKWQNLSVTIDKSVLEPNGEARIKFEWIGEFQKENYERSASFVASGIKQTKFTVPFLVAGTNPTPIIKSKPKGPVPKNAANPAAIKKEIKPAVKKSGE